MHRSLDLILVYIKKITSTSNTVHCENNMFFVLTIKRTTLSQFGHFRLNSSLNEQVFSLETWKTIKNRNCCVYNYQKQLNCNFFSFKISRNGCKIFNCRRFVAADSWDRGSTRISIVLILIKVSTWCCSTTKFMNWWSEEKIKRLKRGPNFEMINEEATTLAETKFWFGNSGGNFENFSLFESHSHRRRFSSRKESLAVK